MWVITVNITENTIEAIRDKSFRETVDIFDESGVFIFKDYFIKSDMRQFPLYYKDASMTISLPLKEAEDVIVDGVVARLKTLEQKLAREAKKKEACSVN